jgi:predicted phage tail protein
MDGDQTVTATFGRPKGTRILKAKINRRKRKARFTFTSRGAITGYQCSLVRKPARRAATRSKKGKKPKTRFSKCSSPRRYKRLKPGRYVFRVRALNVLGTEAVPAKRKFKLKDR